MGMPKYSLAAKQNLNGLPPKSLRTPSHTFPPSYAWTVVPAPRGTPRIAVAAQRKEFQRRGRDYKRAMHLVRKRCDGSCSFCCLAQLLRNSV
jgi:hypothetical protein